MKKFKVGDKFKYNLQLMEENQISMSATDTEIHTVLRVQQHAELGEIVTHKLHSNGMPMAQCNAVWLERVE